MNPEPNRLSDTRPHAPVDASAIDSRRNVAGSSEPPSLSGSAGTTIAPDVFIDAPAPDTDRSQGPGCIIWAIVGLFCIVIATGFVGLSGYSGWSEGLRVARVTATARQQGEIDLQCSSITSDLAAGNLGLAQRRFEVLTEGGNPPPCTVQLAPTATAQYLTSQPTATIAATATATPEPTDSATVTPAASDVTPQASAPASSASGFDLDALLNEARIAQGEQRYTDAIDTLEAIKAIDSQYKKAEVDQLLFGALTTQARNFYRLGTNLAQANLLVDRAEEYGNVDTLNYERYIATLYLDARPFLNTNYGLAIEKLQTIINVNTNYLDTRELLVGQYIAYADAFALEGRPCQAVIQYDNASQLQAGAGCRRQTQRCPAGLRERHTDTGRRHRWHSNRTARLSRRSVSAARSRYHIRPEAGGSVGRRMPRLLHHDDHRRRASPAHDALLTILNLTLNRNQDKSVMPEAE